jgi:hypothetical protein
MYEGEDGYGDEGDDPYGDEAGNDKNDGMNALNLQFVYGFNKDIDQGVHNLTTSDRTVRPNIKTN